MRALVLCALAAVLASGAPPIGRDTVLAPAVTADNEVGTFCNPLDLDYRFTLENKGSRNSRREAADPAMVVLSEAFAGKPRYLLFASKSGGYWHSPDLLSWTLVEPKGLPLEDYAPAVVELDGALYFTASFSKALYRTTDPTSW